MVQANRQIVGSGYLLGAIFCMTLAFLGLGCSNSHQVQNNLPDHNLTYEQFNKEVSNQIATVVFADDTNFAARNISVKSDSLSWTDMASNMRRSAPVEKILRVEIKDRLHGALDGLAVGAFCTLASTVAIMWSGCWSNALFLPGAGVMGMFGLVGADRGHKTEYYFHRGEYHESVSVFHYVDKQISSPDLKEERMDGIPER